MSYGATLHVHTVLPMLDAWALIFLRLVYPAFITGRGLVIILETFRLTFTANGKSRLHVSG